MLWKLERHSTSHMRSRPVLVRYCIELYPQSFHSSKNRSTVFTPKSRSKILKKRKGLKIHTLSKTSLYLGLFLRTVSASPVFNTCSVNKKALDASPLCKCFSCQSVAHSISCGDCSKFSSLTAPGWWHQSDVWNSDVTPQQTERKYREFPVPWWQTVRHRMKTFSKERSCFGFSTCKSFAASPYDCRPG